MFVRPQVIISEARGDANWMFAKTRAPSEAVQKSVSRGKAPTSIKASEPSSPPRGDVAPMWGGESLFRGVLCKGRGLRCWPISNSVRSEASGSYLEERASCANLRPTPGNRRREKSTLRSSQYSAGTTVRRAAAVASLPNLWQGHTHKPVPNTIARYDWAQRSGCLSANLVC
jgi:hypothetical protein